MAVAVGLMSGTSMDGIDACLVEIRSGAKDGHMKDADDDLELTLIAFLTKPYPAGVQHDLFRLSQGERGAERDRERGAEGDRERGAEGDRERGAEGDRERGGVADVCRYNFLLGHLFADAAKEVVVKAGRSMNDVAVIGSHGQTIQHLPGPHTLHGYSVASTLQLGDPALIANQCRVTTVGDFRVADMAVGGQGAPLVPYLDHMLLLRHYRKTGRVGLLLNIGGISNITALLPVSGELIGFDCGPGNILIDALMRKWYSRDFDRDGHTGSEGEVSQLLLESLMADGEDYVHTQPPKSSGREVYDGVYVESVITRSMELGLSTQDTVATVTALTVAMVGENYERHIRPRLDQQLSTDPQSSAVSRYLFVSGGGAHNIALMNSLQERLPAVCVTNTAALGVDPDAKEAMLFALLAYQTLRGVCTNISSVTGANRQTILGKICPVPNSPQNLFT